MICGDRGCINTLLGLIKFFMSAFFECNFQFLGRLKISTCTAVQENFSTAVFISYFLST